MSKARKRREEVERIIRDETVQSQQELLELLRGAGFEVTQPTLSRDLRELGVAKTPEGYVLPGDVAGSISPFVPRTSLEERFEAVVASSVLSAAVSGTMVVVRTPPAEAHPVARAIDEAQLDGVAGSIAGDDTVFIAMTSKGEAGRFAARLTRTIPGASTRRRTRP